MSNEAESSLPFYVEGKVVKGFQRGSKALGFPTANFDDNAVATMPASMDNGVYFGWVNISNGPVYKMLVSIGWNPYFKNEKKSMEVHILNKFEEDFYGSQIKAVIIGYLRPMLDFNSIDELRKAIADDLEKVIDLLEEPESAVFKDDKYFIAEKDS